MTVREAFLKYFAFNNEEFDKKYREFFGPAKYERLINILKAIIPFCDKYNDITDDKTKHKVGNVLIDRLDYSTFSEVGTETYSRLQNLFKNTTERNINPYKIIYCSVLSDGDLKNDREENSKYPVDTRKFTRIYDSLKFTLGLSDQETAALFEKCSTLISKVYSNRIPEVYRHLHNLLVKGNNFAYRIFDEQEVIDILKINPSLFTVSSEKMASAFSFIKDCSKPLAEQPHPRYYENSEQNYLCAHGMIIKKWLKNNSTLLSMNADAMRSKYNLLLQKFGKNSKHNYEKQIRSYFSNPVTLSILNSISLDDLRWRAEENVFMLEALADKESVGKYLLDNPYFLAMSPSKVNDLLLEIKVLDSQNPDADYLQTFLDAGKSLFKGSSIFNVEDVVKKLKTKSTLPEIDVENMEGIQLLDVFCDVFNKGDKKIADEIKALIEKKDQRQLKHEKEIRVAIRSIGERFRDMPRILKDEKISKREKANSIRALLPVLCKLQQQRFELAKTRSIFTLEEIERQNSSEIENALNVIREIYELRKDKVNERYIGGDVLYEKLMDYLGKEFDDKKSIDKLFHEDVTQEYEKLIVENFNARKNEQTDLFKSQSYVVPKENRQDEIYSALKKVGKEINAADSKFDVNFEK